VDEYIDQMVTEYLEPAKVMIQGKCQAGHWSIKNSRVVTIGIESSLKIFPGYFFEVQIGVIGNVWFIVEMPRTVEGISVYRKNEERQRYNGKDYYTAV